MTGPPPPPPPAPTAALNEYIDLDSSITLGTLVANIRHARDMSQFEFARFCGVGRRFVQDLERGKPTLRFDKLARVLDALGLALKIQPR